ncbi:uncharacterized protein VP01_17g15 [Puccinia sorghi]|uniref:Retrotransposon gag domain-containing protein n=1 Tax=Puccinia sorghi TaxID=27349 RepID=A0A0L6VEC9_9BASI|nr:uncharacterized protein VP01_17g15 [Puccinia sorghi]
MPVSYCNWPPCYPKRFPTNASKVVFAVLFMKDYAATWSQPYLDKVFNGKLVVCNDFLDDFKSRFFDHNHQHRAKLALQNLHQTGIVLSYTQDFNSRTVGGADTLLMSLYQHSLKDKIQLAMVMSNVEFDSLQSMQVMALKAGQTIEGIQQGCTTPSTTSISAPGPNAMELFAFQKAPRNQLSNTEQTCWVQRNLCFRCGQAGHISRGFLNGVRKPQEHLQPGIIFI